MCEEILEFLCKIIKNNNKIKIINNKLIWIKIEQKILHICIIMHITKSGFYKINIIKKIFRLKKYYRNKNYRDDKFKNINKYWNKHNFILKIDKLYNNIHISGILKKKSHQFMLKFMHNRLKKEMEKILEKIFNTSFKQRRKIRIICKI